MGRVGESFSDNAVQGLKEDITMNSRKGRDWGREVFQFRDDHYS